jgi:hypothetical protein
VQTVLKRCVVLGMISAKLLLRDNCVVLCDLQLLQRLQTFRMPCLHSSRVCSKAVKGKERNYPMASSTSPSHQSPSEHVLHIYVCIIFITTDLHSKGTTHPLKILRAQLPIRRFGDLHNVALCGPKRLENYCIHVQTTLPKAGTCGGTGSQGQGHVMASRPDLGRISG